MDKVPEGGGEKAGAVCSHLGSEGYNWWGGKEDEVELHVCVIDQKVQKKTNSISIPDLSVPFI